MMLMQHFGIDGNSLLPWQCLEGEQQQERHHQTEQTHGLGQGETQDGVREQLLLEAGVSGVADDEGAEHRPDTSS